MLMFEPKNCGKIFTVCCGQASQSIGRGRIGREGALDVREGRERRDKIFRFYEQDRLLCARVDIGVTESPTKIAKKDEKNGSEILFSKVGVRNPVFSGEFSCFWPRKN